MKILQDIKIAANIFGKVRKARESGASAVQIKPVYTVPVVTFKPAYMNTIESCQTWKLGRDTNQAVEAVYNGLPYETQRKLEFTPKEAGGWVARAKFWQKELKPALLPKMYHATMALLINRYAHCLRMRKGAEA